VLHSGWLQRCSKALGKPGQILEDFEHPLITGVKSFNALGIVVNRFSVNGAKQSNVFYQKIMFYI
jgi:hypothetical protein